MFPTSLISVSFNTSHEFRKYIRKERNQILKHHFKGLNLSDQILDAASFIECTFENCTLAESIVDWNVVSCKFIRCNIAGTFFKYPYNLGPGIHRSCLDNIRAAFIDRFSTIQSVYGEELTEQFVRGLISKIQTEKFHGERRTGDLVFWMEHFNVPMKLDPFSIEEAWTSHIRGSNAGIFATSLVEWSREYVS